LIFEHPPGFWIGKAGAGAICVEELKIICGGEWWNDIVVNVVVRGDIVVGDCVIGLSRIGEVVMQMQMQGEEMSEGAVFLRVEGRDGGISW